MTPFPMQKHCRWRIYPIEYIGLRWLLIQPNQINICQLRVRNKIICLQLFTTQSLLPSPMYFAPFLTQSCTFSKVAFALVLVHSCQLFEILMLETSIHVYTLLWQDLILHRGLCRGNVGLIFALVFETHETSNKNAASTPWCLITASRNWICCWKAKLKLFGCHTNAKCGRKCWSFSISIRMRQIFPNFHCAGGSKHNAGASSRMREGLQPCCFCSCSYVTCRNQA